MWGVWKDEIPLASFCWQEVLDGCKLRCGLEHLIDCREFIGCSLEIATIVRMNVLFVSFNTVEMLFRNDGWLNAHLINVTPTILSSVVNSC